MNNNNDNIAVVRLGSTTAKFYIELTMNYPRSARFVKMRTAKQHQFYNQILSIVLQSIGPGKLELENKCFEINGDGNYHCHALIRCVTAVHHFPIGVVSDMVKTYLELLPKKYSKYSGTAMHPGYVRYRCPSIVCQYRDMTDPHVDVFRNYIDKYKLLKEITNINKNGKEECEATQNEQTK